MPWFRIKLSSFGVGRDAGPPPSYRVGFIRVLWRDWDAWEAWAKAQFERYERALKAAQEELRK